MRHRTPSLSRTAAGVVAAAAILAAGCATVDAPAVGAAQDTAAKSVIRGNVVYREKIALPADAELTMRLVDITHPAKPVVIAEKVTPLAGRQVPIPFTLPFDPAKATGEVNALRATIRYDGKIQFVTGARVILTPDSVPEMLTMAVIKGSEEPNAGDQASSASGPPIGPTRNPSTPQKEQRPRKR